MRAHARILKNRDWGAELLISFMCAGTRKVTGSIEGWMFSEQLSPSAPSSPQEKLKVQAVYRSLCLFHCRGKNRGVKQRQSQKETVM